MTAEIAIFNNGAIALAADSAVTWSVGDSRAKIYNTVNKLFTLSKYHPVGVMVYGSAELMGIPWESIIKMYRQEAGPQRYERLEEYADGFRAFLTNNERLFPKAGQRRHVQQITVAYFKRIKSDVDKRVKAQTKKNTPIADAEIEAIVRTVVNEHLQGWETTPLLGSVTDADVVASVAEYEESVNAAITAVFEAMPIPAEARLELHRISGNLMARRRAFAPMAGVVIAGFGEYDVQPVLQETQVYGVALNQLRYEIRQTRKAAETGPTILPFAQSEMVSTFMEGVNPKVRQTVSEFLAKVMTELPAEILSVLAPHLSSLSADTLTNLETSLKGACANITHKLNQRVKDYTTTQHVLPIIRAVSALPKDQLAEMAESLVNLTSFRQKVSGETETVGGPIDVAVISKGDGFVWIKRKHYFKPELNQHFFANYYRRDEVAQHDPADI
jgi:hypothetical protein